MPIIGIGIIGGIGIGSDLNPALGFAIALFVCVFGLILFLNSQMVLIYIDTENNTRKIANETQKTNAMLSEALGIIIKTIDKSTNSKN